MEREAESLENLTRHLTVRKRGGMNENDNKVRSEESQEEVESRIAVDELAEYLDNEESEEKKKLMDDFIDNTQQHANGKF